MNHRMHPENRERNHSRESMRDFDRNRGGPHYRARDERDWRDAGERSRGEFRTRYHGGGEYLRDVPEHRVGWPDVNYEYEHDGDYADEVVGGDYVREARGRDPDLYERRRDDAAATHAATRYRPRERDYDRLLTGYGESSGYRESARGSDERSGLYGSDYPVRGGYRGKGPRGYVRADERIREDLCERLTQDDTIDASDIGIDVQNGIVTLNGSVEQRWIKHRVEDIADACSGVKDVVNQLRVEPGQNSQIPMPT